MASPSTPSIARDARRSAAAAVATTCPSILVVEDDAAVAELLRLNLSHRRFEVRLAGSVGEAQRAIRLQVPEIALLDWELPDGSGLLLLQGWRSERATRSLPVVMLTGRHSTLDISTALANGADDYLTKPCSIADVHNRLCKALFRRGFPRAGS